MSVAKDPSSLNGGLSGSQAGRHEVASAWVQLDQLCDRFEAAWLAGERPSVESFLDEVPPAYQREALLELVKLDAHYRQPSADAPTVEEYQQRFPLLESVWLRRLLQSRSSALSAPGSSAKALNGTGSAAGIPSIPGYDVLELVGRGGMGVVYKARDVKLHRLVALKMVSAGDLASPEMLERFRAEARAVASLQHPNLVQIHEVGEHQGRPYLAFEFVVGGSLEQRLRGEPQLPAAAARLVKSLAHTIQFAHSRAIIHRDLKPANILLSPADLSHGSHVDKPSRAPLASGKASPKSSRPSIAPSVDDSSRSRGELDSVFGIPKISDFGLAKHLESDEQQTCSGAILGTPSYMAPEQAAGRADLIGPPTDVYALGAILYEMLTGRPPFRAPSVIETLDQVRTLEPVSPRAIQPTVPRDLETICLKCLSKEPARRYESAGELADDLDRFLRDEPVRARPVGSTERAWRWCRRHPLVATLVLLLIVVTGSGFAGVFQQWRKAEVLRRLADDNASAARFQRDAAQAQRQRADANRQLAEASAATAEEARADAERNQQRAEISLASAEARFQQGRKAVKEIFDVGNELLKQPRMESAGRKVLEKAAQLQDALLADKSSDPSVRFESARIAKSVGWTQHELGLHAAAEESTRKAIDLFQSLVAERPGESALGREVRATYTQLGFICWARKELDFASESFQEGVRLAEELANRPDHEPYDIGALGHTLTNWGAFLAARGDLGQAIETTDRSVVLLRELVEVQPKNDWFRAELALALGGQAGLVWPKDHVKGERLAREALDHRRVLQAKEYGSRRHSEYTARSYQQLAEMCRATGRVAEADDLLKNAVNTLTLAVSLFPDHVALRRRLLESLGLRRELALQRGDADSADQMLSLQVNYARAPVTDSPELPNDQLLFARLQRDSARLKLRQNQPASAATSLGVAIQYFKRLHENSSDKKTYLPELLEVMNEYARLGRSVVPESRLLAMMEDRLRLLPEDPGANNSLAWWLSVARDKQLLNPDRAVELARKAVQLKPDMANFHNTLGTALYRAGKLQEAQVELEKSLELKYAEPALNQYLLAAIAHRTGKSEEAQALFAQAAQDHQTNHADDGDHAHLAAEVKTLLMP